VNNKNVKHRWHPCLRKCPDNADEELTGKAAKDKAAQDDCDGQ